MVIEETPGNVVPVAEGPLLGPQKTGARTALRRIQIALRLASFLPVAFPTTGKPQLAVPCLLLMLKWHTKRVPSLPVVMLGRARARAHAARARSIANLLQLHMAWVCPFRSLSLRAFPLNVIRA